MKNSEKLLKNIIEKIEYGSITRNQLVQELDDVLTEIGNEEE